uniref:Uncharacterized protein n=1 Tax=Oryza glumipatula TaxID=40148 RepID=A0A0D9YEK6_9ORYZ
MSIESTQSSTSLASSGGSSSTTNEFLHPYATVAVKSLVPITLENTLNASEGSCRMPIAYKSPLLQNVQERCSKFDDTMKSQVHCAMGNLAILKSIMEVNGEEWLTSHHQCWIVDPCMKRLPNRGNYVFSDQTLETIGHILVFPGIPAGEKYFNQLSKPWCQLSMRRKRHCRLTGATIQEFT